MILKENLPYNFWPMEIGMSMSLIESLNFSSSNTSTHILLQMFCLSTESLSLFLLFTLLNQNHLLQNYLQDYIDNFDYFRRVLYNAELSFSSAIFIFSENMVKNIPFFGKRTGETEQHQINVMSGRIIPMAYFRILSK